MTSTIDTVERTEPTTRPRLVNLHDYENAARQVIPRSEWDYYAGGSDDEVTLRANESAFDALRLRPRMLIDVTGTSPKTTALGTPISMPILVAPSAYQAMAHRDGELATARATAAAGTIMIASINSSYSLEEIAATADGPKWLQFYIYYGGDLQKSIPLLRRAEAAGYRAIVLTVDTPVFGKKERNLRNEFSLPPGIRAANFSNPDGKAPAPCGITWEAVEQLQRVTELPVILKGVLTAEDAELAVAHGVAGIMVSNHGGRQLDSVCAGIEALPEVVEVVSGRCEVFCDGGIRRGTDVVKALALGARAVLVGRPILWGLAVDGAAGVGAVLECLRGELVRAMKLLGRPTITDIDAMTVRKY